MTASFLALVVVDYISPTGRHREVRWSAESTEPATVFDENHPDRSEGIMCGGGEFGSMTVVRVDGGVA